MTSVADRIMYLVERQKVSRSEFARRLKMDPSNFLKYLSGKLAMPDSVVNRIALDLGVSRAWLRDGTGAPFDKEQHAATLAAPGPAPAPRRPGGEAGRGVAVYDIDVMAGTQPLDSLFTSDRIIGRIDLPQLNPDSFIVRVSGDSMEPVVRNGAYVNIRPVNPRGVIFWGQIYVVVLEQYRMVKYVRRDSDPAQVLLHSANPCSSSCRILCCPASISAYTASPT